MPLARTLLLATVAVLSAPAPALAQQPAGPPEAISLLGDTLRAPALAEETRRRLEMDREAAAANVAARPGDVDALIWLGRRTAYLGRYRDAIAVFDSALRLDSSDARLWRHRGHRWITVRQLDSAVHDLSIAARLVAGTPDEVEPDGMPNARNIPTSTLQSNTWYHLGLAHYLRAEWEQALAAYREALRVSTNPDMLVATSHWLYMTLRRMGRDAEAAQVLAPISADMDVIENDAYHRLLLLYRGELEPDALLPPAALGDRSAAIDPAVAYGVGHWHQYNGRTVEAQRIYRRLVGAGSGQWAAFGYIAAEAELARAGPGAASP